VKEIISAAYKLPSLWYFVMAAWKLNASYFYDIFQL
jgi:hypothetical protein